MVELHKITNRICSFQDGTAIASPKKPGSFRDAKNVLVEPKSMKSQLQPSDIVRSTGTCKMSRRQESFCRKCGCSRCAAEKCISILLVGTWHKKKHIIFSKEHDPVESFHVGGGCLWLRLLKCVSFWGKVLEQFASCGSYMILISFVSTIGCGQLNLFCFCFHLGCWKTSKDMPICFIYTPED